MLHSHKEHLGESFTEHVGEIYIKTSAHEDSSEQTALLAMMQ